MAKIVHIVRDEKFTDMAYREFEAVAPGQNLFVIIGNERPLQYVNTAPLTFYTLRQARKILATDAWVAVVFHTLSSRRLLRDIPADKCVIWLGWGFDYYDALLSGDFREGLLLPETIKLVEQYGNRGNTAIQKTAELIKKRIMGGVFWGLGISDRQLLPRVDYFSPVLETEYEMAVRLNPWFKPQYVEWNYGTVEDDMEGPTTAGLTLGENVLVGNSADPSNNHLEIFELLERHVDFSNKKIIVPLSYGEEWYRKAIIGIGEKKFGDSFVPLVNFLDRKAYLDVLQSCGFVFMNHLRQQAVSNICIMMIKGAKIYLNSRSPAYEWFLEKGCSLGSCQSLCNSDQGQKLVLEPPSDEERQVNAQVVRAYWGRDAQRKKTRHLIDILMKNKK